MEMNEPKIYVLMINPGLGDLDYVAEKRGYRTYDNKFFARLKNGTDLGIMSESIYRRFARKVAAEKKPK